jgi:hypothetical protein
MINVSIVIVDTYGLVRHGVLSSFCNTHATHSIKDLFHPQTRTYASST